MSKSDFLVKGTDAIKHKPCEPFNGTGHDPRSEDIQFPCKDCMASGVDCSDWTREELDRNMLAYIVYHWAPSKVVLSGIWMHDLEKWVRAVEEKFPADFLRRFAQDPIADEDAEEPDGPA